MIETFRLAARDGYALGATLFRPRADSGRAALVMAATGVPQEYYAKFAAYLAGRGFTVLTFDYRGIGRSRSGDIRALNARMRDWAELDGAAALAVIKETRQKVLVVGHQLHFRVLAQPLLFLVQSFAGQQPANAVAAGP